MEHKHRKILRHKWSNIRDDLEPKNVLPKLVTVLTETEEEEIKAQSTRHKRCDKLLEILPRKGENAFEVFVKALKKDVPHLASVLIEAGNEEDPNRSSAFWDEVSIYWRKEELSFHPNAILAEYPFIKI